MSNSEQPNIAIIGAAAFLHVSKLLGSHNFELCLYSSDIQANSTKLAETSDLSNIPSEYHKFAKLKLKFSLLIVLMTSKSIWKKMLNLRLALYTLCQYQNKRFWRSSLRKILTQVSSDQPHLHMVHQSYLLRRKTVHCAFVSTSTVSTVSPKRIVIYSCLSLIY